MAQNGLAKGGFTWYVTSNTWATPMPNLTFVQQSARFMTESAEPYLILLPYTRLWYSVPSSIRTLFTAMTLSLCFRPYLYLILCHDSQPLLPTLPYSWLWHSVYVSDPHFTLYCAMTLSPSFQPYLIHGYDTKSMFQALTLPLGRLQVLINICIVGTRESTWYLSIPHIMMLQHE